MKIGNNDRRRSGITLFEVVVALVIFTLALPALNALMLVGSRLASESALMSRASIECRSKLAEITVGAESMSTTDWTPLPDPSNPANANWYWKANVVDGDVDGIKQVQVSVKYEIPGSNPEMRVSLSAMIMDPMDRGSTQDRGILDAAILASGGTVPSASSSTSGTTASGNDIDGFDRDRFDFDGIDRNGFDFDGNVGHEQRRNGRHKRRHDQRRRRGRRHRRWQQHRHGRRCGGWQRRHGQGRIPMIARQTRAASAAPYGLHPARNGARTGHRPGDFGRGVRVSQSANHPGGDWPRPGR